MNVYQALSTGLGMDGDCSAEPLEAEGNPQDFGFLSPSALALTVASGEQGQSIPPSREGAGRKNRFYDMKNSSVKFTV